MTRYEVELTEEQAQAVADGYSTGPRAQDKYRTQAWEALAEAILANPPKPLRMTEPGFGRGNVIAHNAEGDTRRLWVRQSSRYSHWTDGRYGWHWTELIDPEPVDGAP